jgi:hypothetical protein
MTFHDIDGFICKAHLLGTVPATRVRLIENGITRQEYAHRFGMDDASFALFNQLEAKSEQKKTALDPPKKMSITQSILELLGKRPEGLLASEIADLLAIKKKIVSVKLNLLRTRGEVRGERFAGDWGSSLRWFVAPVSEDGPHSSSDQYPTVIDIQKCVARAFDCSWRTMMGESRSGPVVRARFAAVYLAEKLKRLSTTDLARRFAKQDHVTIINALSRAREFMKSEPDFAGRVALVEQELLRGRS